MSTNQGSHIIGDLYRKVKNIDPGNWQRTWWRTFPTVSDAVLNFCSALLILLMCYFLYWTWGMLGITTTLIPTPRTAAVKGLTNIWRLILITPPPLTFFVATMGVCERCRKLCPNTITRQGDEALCDVCETPRVRTLQAEHQRRKTRSASRSQAAQHPHLAEHLSHRLLQTKPPLHSRPYPSRHSNLALMIQMRLQSFIRQKSSPNHMAKPIRQLLMPRGHSHLLTACIAIPSERWVARKRVTWFAAVYVSDGTTNSILQTGSS